MAILEPGGRDIGAQVHGTEEIFYRHDANLTADAVFNTPVMRDAAAGDWIRRGALNAVEVHGETAGDDSDAGGVVIEHSMDGANVHHSDAIRGLTNQATTIGGEAFSEVVDLKLKFWRFQYNQGSGGATTDFHVEVRGYPVRG